VKGAVPRVPMADINVTPFVDVVLVLLIIFMVTAPFLQGGLEIDLPRVATRGLDVREGLIVSVRDNGTVAVGNSVVPVPLSSRRTRACRTGSSWN
jgi:biopolymer transport protein TolR